jgi:hypothetical protein
MAGLGTYFIEAARRADRGSVRQQGQSFAELSVIEALPHGLGVSPEKRCNSAGLNSWTVRHPTSMIKGGLAAESKTSPAERRASPAPECRGGERSVLFIVFSGAGAAASLVPNAQMLHSNKHVPHDASSSSLFGVNVFECGPSWDEERGWEVVRHRGPLPSVVVKPLQLSVKVSSRAV